MSSKRPSISAASPRSWMREAILALATVAWGAGGCAQLGVDLGRGGLSAQDDAQWSLALAQVRAQAPKGRVSGLVYESRPEPAGLKEPELALTGEGDALSQGFQTGERSHLRLSVFLDKTSYTRGYLKVNRGGAPEEIWPIVSYQLRGQADRDFQFTYLVSDPGGALRTLMLIGGGYQENGDDLLAIEGALFIPASAPKSKRFSPAGWQVAYPLAFVLKEPRQPAYDVLITVSEEVARDLEKNVAELDRMSKRLDALSAGPGADSRGTAPAAPPPAGAAATAPPSGGEDGRRAAVALELRQKAEAAQANAVHYFELRAEADTLLAAYLESNAYRWRDADGRRRVFARWDAPDRHAADLDALLSQLLAYVPSPQKIEQARSAFRAVLAKNRNGEKRPAAKDN